MQEEKTRREKDMGTKETLVHDSPKYAALLLLKKTGTKYKKKLLDERMVVWERGKKLHLF